jgi:phosphoribosyl-AMP cyclohydrolase
MSLSKKEIEQGDSVALDFSKLQKISDCDQDVIPAVAQDIASKEVLIIGYVNKKALDYALANKVVTFWSTSRNELWIKGATSGDFLDLVEVRVNCEQNSILYLASIRGAGACHTKDSRGQARNSCFYRKIEDEALKFI